MVLAQEATQRDPLKAALGFAIIMVIVLAIWAVRRVRKGKGLRINKVGKTIKIGVAVTVGLVIAVGFGLLITDIVGWWQRNDTGAHILAITVCCILVPASPIVFMLYHRKRKH